MGIVIAQLSDHSATKFGKRTPYLIVSSMVAGFFLVVMVAIGDSGTEGFSVFGLYMLLGIGYQCGYQAAMAAYQPLLPDLVPSGQLSTASGWYQSPSPPQASSTSLPSSADSPPPNGLNLWDFNLGWL